MTGNAIDYFGESSSGLFGNQPETSFPMAFPMLGDGLMGVGGSLVASIMAQQLGLPGNWQGQLFPTLNPADFMNKQRWFAGKQQAMRSAATADREQYIQMMRGLARLTNTPFGSEQQAAATALADNMATFAPIMAQVMPMEFDAIHGARGSAVVMADSIYRGGRYAVDPVTGKTGLRGEVAGQLSSMIKENYFGSVADVAEFKGLSAGQTGMMYEELANRGMLTRGIGTFQEDVQRELIAETPGSAVEALKLLRTKDRTRFDSLVRDAEDRSGTSLSGAGRSDDQRLRDIAEVEGVSTELARELKKFGDSPEMEQMLVAFDARKIKDRLKGMAGAVAAMRDIFGDAGKANAPMAELLSGLSKMTQDGMSSMSTSEIEQSVRMTYRLAKQSGMGLDAMMGMQGQLGQFTDMYGLDRGFAIRAGQDMAAYGGAYKDLGLGAQTEFGKFGIDKSAMLAAQLRVRAAASPAANMMSTAYRLQDTGAVQADSDLARYLQAIDSNQTTFTDGQGRERNVNMTQSDFITMAAAGSGMNPNEIGLMAQQNAANAEYGLRHDVSNKTLRLMGVEQSEMILRDAFGDSLSSLITRNGARLGLNEQQQAGMRRFIGSSIGQELLNNDDAMDPNKRNQLVADTIRRATQQYLEQNGRSAGDAAILAAGFSSSDLTQAADMALGEGTQRLSRQTSYGNIGNFINQHNRTVLERMDTQRRQAQQFVDQQVALSGVGRSGFMQRITDEMTSGNDLQTALGNVLGQQSEATMRAALAPVQAALDDVRRNPKMPNASTYEEALQVGGQTAREALIKYAEDQNTTVDELKYETDVLARGLRRAGMSGGTRILGSKERVASWTTGYFSLKDQLDALDKEEDTPANLERRRVLTKRMAAISAGGQDAKDEFQAMITADGLTAADVAKMENGDFSMVPPSARDTYKGLLGASKDTVSVSERLEMLGYYGDAAMTANDVRDVANQGKNLGKRTDVLSDDYGTNLRSLVRRQNSVIDAVAHDTAMWSQLGRERDGDKTGVRGLSATELIKRSQELQSERDRAARDWLSTPGTLTADQQSALDKYGRNVEGAYAAGAEPVRQATERIRELEDEMARRMSLDPNARETLDATDSIALDKLRMQRSRTLKDAIASYYTTITPKDQVTKESVDRVTAIADSDEFKDAPARFAQEVSGMTAAVAEREKFAKSLNFKDSRELKQAITDNKVSDEDTKRYYDLTAQSGELGRLADSDMRNDPDATREVLIQIRDSLAAKQEEKRMVVEGTVQILDNGNAKLNLQQSGKGSTPVGGQPRREVNAL